MRAVLRWLGPAVGLVLLVLAVRALARALGDRGWRDLLRSLASLPADALLLASALTVTSYLVLTAYDTLALHHVQRPLPWRQLARVSFVAYALSLNVGLPALSASAVRLRLYGARGLSAADVARVLAFCFVTTWVGYATVAGLVFLTGTVPMPEKLAIPPFVLRGIGACLLAATTAYLVIAWKRTEPLRVRRFELPLPGPRLAALQLLASAVQCLTAAAVAWAVLRPVAHVTYRETLAAFVLASIAGLVSHVPGGLGVAEATFVMAFQGRADAAALIGALLAWRATFYLVPLALAVIVLGWELIENRAADGAKSSAAR